MSSSSVVDWGMPSTNGNRDSGRDLAVVGRRDQRALLAHLGGREPDPAVEEVGHEAQLVEDLEGAGLDAARLAQPGWRVGAVDDPAAHAVVVQHGRQGEPDRAGADDENRELLHRRDLDPGPGCA